MHSISTDQIHAFVELAQTGSLREAAQSLLISEQGLRNRLLALENAVGKQLYRKQRGPRRTSPLTSDGQIFLPQAQQFLQQAQRLAEVFSPQQQAVREIHIVASQYLLRYVLTDAIARFQKSRPAIRIRLSTHSEREIGQALLDDPQVTIGLAAPYESGTDLEYQHLLSQNWGLIVPQKSPFAGKVNVRLKQIANEPLILFEKGSTGRQHILDAFYENNLQPNVTMETTTTEVIVRMVEAGLGIAIIPLLPSGVITLGKKVALLNIREKIRPIHSGILSRRGETFSDSVKEFITVIREVAGK